MKKVHQLAQFLREALTTSGCVLVFLGILSASLVIATAKFFGTPWHDIIGIGLVVASVAVTISFFAYLFTRLGD